MAIVHNMAIKLEASDLRARYEKGEYPKAHWEIEAKKDAEEDANDIQFKLITSFSLVLLGAIIAVTVAYLSGNINSSYPLNVAKCLTFIGSFLASWATLMELGGALATWKGEALHEKIHPVLFQLLFVPGVCLVLTGISI